ncbi:MAG: hypothetical protein JO219_05740 [Candidatus Eremiobacteraeota bacterium]|nr:hypothetical protein [Candidatus Eremiobacteraeota bacterium]MBV8365632.1 hypothetical protein [Candidatus Eremiobacteraeota bacterium]
MFQTLARTRIAAQFALAGALMFMVPAPASATAFLPDGTYDYTFKQGTSVVANSSVTVKRTGSVISIHESQTVTQTQVGAVQLTADETVLADSIQPLSFSGVTVSSGRTSEVKFAYTNGSGFFVINGERNSVPVRMLPGTQAMLVQDQSLAMSFLTLPSVLSVSRAFSITTVVPTASRTFLMSVDPAPQTKPSGLPGPDVGVGIASPITFSVWFDPTSGVVDEIDVPSQSLTINLTKRS